MAVRRQRCECRPTEEVEGLEQQWLRRSVSGAGALNVNGPTSARGCRCLQIDSGGLGRPEALHFCKLPGAAGPWNTLGVARGRGSHSLLPPLCCHPEGL